jgi:PilZ domain-containing protein
VIAPERIPLDRGQLVVIGVPDESSRRWYRGQVEQRQRDLVWVAMPGEDEVPQPPSGTEVLLDTWRLTDARYRLRTLVIAASGPAPLGLGLRIVESARIQRREYFRVPVALRPRRAVRLLENGGEEGLELMLRDLSAGGLRARGSCGLRAASATPLETDDLISLSLWLPGQPDELLLRARVTRVVDSVNDARFSCEIGAAFLNVSSDEREQLIQYTLSVQLDHLRRGAL